MRHPTRTWCLGAMSLVAGWGFVGGCGPTGGGSATTGGATGGTTAASGGSGGSVGTGGRDMGAGDASGSGDLAPGACEPGGSTTAWATICPTEPPATCTPGTWTSWGSSSPENYPVKYETAHFAFLWPDGRNVTMQQVQSAGEFMENVLWKTYLGSPIFWPEPYCNTANKLKTSVHIIENGLYGGCNRGPGLWVGPGAMMDHWGLGHEWAHALQCQTPGFPDCGAGGCWIHESHANFMPHQLPEYRGQTHCSDILVNAPHLYYGSTRNRYCNWQFFEFLKDRYCYKAVNEMWTAPAPAGERDPWTKLARNMGWTAEQLNDAFGEWAMHNITWDYKDPPPTAGASQSATYRARYGPITDKSRPERRLRLTALEPLDGQWTQSRRFSSPYFWAPQRWGYNIVRLHPDPGATSVTVTFRGVTQTGASSGWRWGLVATDANLTTSRYSPVQRGADGQLTFCVGAGESLWLVVVGAPTTIQKIIWDQPYPSIYRYPYMVELRGAWPEGFRGGQQEPCPSGTQRHQNGGGCAPPGLPASVHVGPHAQVLGGNVTAGRIEDHATVLGGATVSGGTVSALTVLGTGFSVGGTARVEATFLPMGFFEAKSVAGSARLYGDLEYRAVKSSGSYFGLVGAETAAVGTITDVNPPPPYTWRP
jgi:hypothetical protein